MQAQAPSTHTSGALCVSARAHRSGEWSFVQQCKRPPLIHEAPFMRGVGPCVCTQSSTCVSGECLSRGCLCLRTKLYLCERQSLALAHEAPVAGVEDACAQMEFHAQVASACAECKGPLLAQMELYTGVQASSLMHKAAHKQWALGLCMKLHLHEWWVLE